MYHARASLEKAGLVVAMKEVIEDELATHLAELRRQHRELDGKIEALHAERLSDQLTLRRLKKQKLQLKDEITRIESRLYPDIIA